MLETIPDIEHIIAADTLANLPAGMKMAVISRVAESLAGQVEDPDTWYETLARYRSANGTDWGTHWASAGDSRHDPIPPDDFHETLPAVLHNWRQTNRALDNTMLSLSMMADRAIQVDKDSVLGIPTDIKKWRSGHAYIADRLGIETRQAAQYRDRANLVRQNMSTIEGPGQEAQLPLVAAAYRAGEVPPENLDTIVRSLKHVGKYLRAVNLSPENIREVFTQLDASFRNAATTVKPAELSKLTDDMLAQAAAIIDADGPPPEEVLNTIENSFRYKIVNHKLKVEIVTDIVNLELFLGIMYAGLNFRAYQNRYYSSPDKAREVLGELLDEQPTTSTSEQAVKDPNQSTLFDSPPAEESQTATDESVQLDAENGAAHGEQDAASDDNPHGGVPGDGFLDDVVANLPEDATPQQILDAADDRLAHEINDRDIHAVTMDGRHLTKEEMDRLDRRPRPERLHDIYIAHLRATGRLDPSVQGLSLFGGAPTQLRVAMDYETMGDLLGDRLQDQFHLPDQYRRPPGLAGFDSGAPRFLRGLELAPEQVLETADEEGTTMIEIDLSKYPDGDGKLQIPKHQRGHPFISRTMYRGTTAPQALRSQLCDAEVIPHTLGTASVLLDRGRSMRTIPSWLKRDLANYGSCSIPDCRAPVAHTDGHHVIWWSHGGKTSSANATLLCPSCHTLVHKRVWTAVFDANGQLYWKPAPWLDPTQTPVRNTYWG